ncbi:hypothetical protein NX801_07910 [Streptomyces sp. LP05-1]|uniref:Uncharacterized protein n=1 Tax=Streptomyces pyxinae TaxID=2970734 RepID=A0ABT2CE02_9ACTN|nr:hypothetical protein [Streptomyces sp. LP05-1]MCS0635586.1 hypothetical protein [Streptomyces sp. LP05-1]
MTTRRAFLTGTTAALSATILDFTTLASGAHAADNRMMREPVSLGVPLSDVLLLGGTVAPGPGGRAALWNVSTGKPAYLNAIDPGTGEQLVSVPLTGADGSWAVTAAPDGVYAGTYGNAHLYRWRPGNAGAAEDLGLPLARQTFIWSLATDEAGKVWGGTFPEGKVFRYDPATGAVKDFGQAVAGQTYVRSLACTGGKVYSGAYASAHIAELDPATGVFTQLPAPPGLDTISGRAVYDLNAHGGRLYARIGSDLPSPLFVYDTAARVWTDKIPEAHGLSVCPPDEEGRVYLIQEGELRRYDPQTKQITGTGLVFDGKVRNARSFGWVELGLPDYPGRSVVGTLWRGEMFRYNPRTGAHAILPTQVRHEPIEILSLADGGRRTVYAGGFLNGGLGAVHTESAASAFHRFAQIEYVQQASDGSVWLGVYPEGRVYRYRPDRTWNSPEYSPAGTRALPANPELIMTLKPYLQMRAKVLAETEGKMVVGTVPEGDRLGGGIAVYDMSTGAWEFTRNVVQDQSVFALAGHQGVMYGGASVTGGLSTTPPTRKAGAVFAWDVHRNTKLWELEPVATEGTVSGLAVGPDGRLWGLAGHTLFAVDLRSRTIVRRLELGTRSTGGTVVVSRGMLYVSVDGGLVFRVNPFASHLDPVLIAAFAHRRMTGHRDGRLYFSRGAELLKLDPRP